MKTSPLTLSIVLSNVKYLYLSVMQINYILFPKIKEEKSLLTQESLRGRLKSLEKGCISTTQ